MDWRALNPGVIEEFRANGGRVARFGDLPLVILHTIGQRTGQVRLVPLILVPDDGELLIYGTAAGAPTHPTWVHSLRARPRITVEIGEERFEADVVELEEEQRRAKVDAMAASVAQFAEYARSAAPREIPVFAIRRR